MTALFLRIVNMSIAASWLILAVLVIRQLLRRAPKGIRAALWGLVGIRLALPFSLESVFSLIPSAETIHPEIMMDSSPAVDTGIAGLDRVVNPVMQAAFTPAPEASANPLQVLLPVLAGIWIVGMAAFAIYGAVSYVSLRRRVAAAIPVGDCIYQCEKAASPFVLGLFRPRIYMPFHLTQEEREAVVAHERAHIARRDPWWKAAGFVLLAVHWFNPLVWLAYMLLCRDLEYACDERVIRELEREKRADYCEALLASSAQGRRFSAGPLAFGEVGVKARVKAVLNYKKPALWLSAAAIVLCLTAAACFLTDPLEETGAEESTNGNAAAQETLQEPERVTEESKETNPSLTGTQAQGSEEISGEYLLAVFAEYYGEENYTVTDWVIAEDGAYGLDGVIQYEDAAGTPWKLAFIRDESVFLVSQEWGEEYEIASMGSLVYLGNGVVCNYVENLQDGTIRLCTMEFSYDEQERETSFKSTDELYEPQEFMDRVYRFQGSEEEESAALTLKTDGTFTFHFSPISSYIGQGTYQIQGERLTAVTQYDDYVYTFDIAGDTLVFDAEASSAEVWYSGLHDGAVLTADP